MATEPTTEKRIYTADEWSEILGEGIHVAFRKGSDHEKAHDYWVMIKDIPDDLWKDALDYVVWSLSYMGLIEVKKEGGLMAKYYGRDLPEVSPTQATSEVREAYSATERCLNTFNSEPAQQLAYLLATNHRTLVQNTMRDLILPFLAHLAHQFEEGRYDDRDEGSAKMAAHLWAQAQDLGIGLPTI